MNISESLALMVKDLLHVAAFVLAAHYGYNLTDFLQEGKTEYLKFAVPWLLSVFLLLYLTKQRYDAEVKEGEDSDE